MGTIVELRDRHARYYAGMAAEQRVVWDGPDQRASLDWFEAEFANLRAGFRWAAAQSAIETAAEATLLGLLLLQFEPVGWAESLLPASASVQSPKLPGLYVAVGLCM